MTDPNLEGMTLAQRLTQGPLEPKKALDILEQLLGGIKVAHDAGLVHGSISPKKIILTPGGKATLTGLPGRDPGAQSMAPHAKGATEPAYVSPEQIVDDPVSPRTDLYSLAVVAYAMLTGKDPFGASEGVAVDNVYYRILYKPASHVPEAALVGLPASVGPALDLAMSKEPKSRFADAKSFLQALRAESAIVAPVPVVPEPKRRRERGGRAWMPYALTGAVIGLLLIIGLGVAYAMGGLGGRSPETTLAAIVTTTSQTAAVDDSTTTTEPVTTTETTISAETTTTATVTTTTTLPPPSTTLSTVSSTTTTKRTTTTVKPTTTTAKPTTTTVKPTTTTTVKPTTTTTAIVKKNATLHVVQSVFPYDGAPHHLVVTATGTSGEDLSSYVDPGPSQTEKGDYTTTYTFAGNANYLSDSRAAILTIQ